SFGQAASWQSCRLIQSVATSAAGWLGVYFGAGLWVTSIIGVTAMLVMMATVGRRYSRFIRNIMLEHPKGPHLDWKADILPMQWRVSLSWLSGYFTFSLFTPVLFHYHGPIVAGQMGMTWNFIAALTGLASSWIAPKAPIFGILIEQRKFYELDKIFWRLTAVVTSVTIAGALLIWVLVYMVGELDHPFSQRMLPPTATACFLIATIILVAGLPMSTYLRAHKKEPLLILSIVNGVITGTLVVLLGKYYSVNAIAVGYLVVMAILTPFNILVWYRCRVAWHRNN
ncbi:MAG: hypothetical protein WCF91_03755, partial [bacterium]